LLYPPVAENDPFSDVKIAGEVTSNAAEDDKKNAASGKTVVDPVSEMVVQPSKTRDNQTEPAEEDCR
jgi:hypothetical protein